MAGDTELFSIVLSKILSKDGYAFDNIFSKVPLVQYMLTKDSKDGATLGTNNRVRKLDGGYDIEIPLEYAVGTSMQAFSGLDPIVFSLKENITNANYSWKHVAQTLLLDNKDILQCKGETRKIENFIGSKVRNINKSMVTSINTMLLALSPGSKDFHSIPQIVYYSPGAQTIGGLAEATHSWWQNKAGASTGTTFAAVMKEIDNLHNTVAYNMSGDSPDIYLTSQSCYEMLVAYQRAKGTHTFVDSGAANIFGLNGKTMMINGATVVWDTACAEPASEASHSAIYMLNTDYLQFCVHQDRQFALEGPEKMIFSQGQDATAWVILLMGNLTCSNRSKQGVLYSIDHTITS